MLLSVSQILGWCDNVHDVLVAETGKHQQFTSRKWMKLVSRYYIDRVNFSGKEDREEIYRDLIGQTCEKLEIDGGAVVKSIFEAAKHLEYPLVPIERLTDRIPEEITTFLVRMAGKCEFVKLVLRYHIMILSEGLFLSINPEVYEMLIDSTELSIIEAFGSPLNNNARGDFREYCSLFPEDAVYGALRRFDEYIETLKIPVRLVVNPPYTPKMIAMTVDKVIAYMNRVHGGEFIMLLPLMFYFEHVDKIRNYGNTCSCMLPKGQHTFYSFFSKTTVPTPTQLYLIVNVANCKQRSEQLLSEIASFLEGQG